MKWKTVKIWKLNEFEEEFFKDNLPCIKNPAKKCPYNDQACELHKGSIICATRIREATSPCGA